MDNYSAQLDIVARRIDSALDRRDPRAFTTGCQLRKSILRQQRAATALLEPQPVPVPDDRDV